MEMGKQEERRGATLMDTSVADAESVLRVIRAPAAARPACPKTPNARTLSYLNADLNEHSAARTAGPAEGARPAPQFVVSSVRRTPLTITTSPRRAAPFRINWGRVK